MVEFNREDGKKAEDGDFPIRFDHSSDEPTSEIKLRDALNRLIIVWDEKEEFACDTANIQYANGVSSCIDDLKELIARNATT